jgi:hypothetical protein
VHTLKCLNQIREHHRHLPALGRIRRSRRGWRNGGRRRRDFLGRFEISDRAQQLSTMTKRRDANLFEILVQSVRISKSIPFSAKRWVYSCIPTWLSQSPIVFIAARRDRPYSNLKAAAPCASLLHAEDSSWSWPGMHVFKVAAVPEANSRGWHKAEIPTTSIDVR